MPQLTCIMRFLDGWIPNDPYFTQFVTWEQNGQTLPSYAFPWIKMFELKKKIIAIHSWISNWSCIKLVLSHFLKCVFHRNLSIKSDMSIYMKKALWLLQIERRNADNNSFRKIGKNIHDYNLLFILHCRFPHFDERTGYVQGRFCYLSVISMIIYR